MSALRRTPRRRGPAALAVGLAAATVLTVGTGTARSAEGTPLPGAEVRSPAGITGLADGVAVVSGDGGDVRVVRGGTQTVLGGGLARGRFTNGATGVAADRAGNLYVGSADEGAVHVFRPDGQRTVHATGLGAPVGLAFASSGDLHVADAGGKRVLRVAPDGAVSQVGATFAERPFGLATGPQGELFVSTQRDGKVFRIDRAGQRSEFADVDGSAEGLAVGRDGAVYVGDGESGTVLRFARAGAEPTTVLEGQNGPIWLGARADGERLLVAVQAVRTGTQAEPAPEGDKVLEVPVDGPLLAAERPQVTPRSVPLAAGTQAFVAGGESVRPSAPLPVAQRSDIGREAAEPTVAVTKKGNVFIPAATFDAAGNALARTEIRASFDRGKTWRTVGAGNDFANPPTTLDPFIFVDPTTDRIYNDDLTLACSYLSFSDDEGESFTVNPVACGLPVNDHQSIATGKPVRSTPIGYPNIFYYCGINQIADTSCAKSLDGGRTFLPGGIAYVGINPGSENLFCGGLAGHVVTGLKGEVYVPRLYCDVPTVAISTDEGTTFTQVKVSEVEGEDFQHESGIAIDSAGNAYYTWIGFDRLPRLAVSRDGGRTWDKEMVLTPPELAQGNLPAIAAFGPGQVAVSFYGSANRCCYEVDEQEPGARDNSQARWSTYVITSSNALAEKPTFYSTTVDPRTDPSVKRACGPGRCGNALDFLGVVVDSTGEVWSSSVDTCTPEPGELSGRNVVGDCVADPAVPQNNRRGIAGHFALPAAAPGVAFPQAGPLAGGRTTTPETTAPRPSRRTLPATGSGAVLPLTALLLAGGALLVLRRRRSA